MNALDVLRVLRRHPFVLALLLILTVAGAGLVYTQLPINYQSTASEIVLPSKYVVTVTNGKAGPATEVNPYRYTGDNPSQITASTLVTAANGSKFKRDLKTKDVRSTPSIAISAAGGGVTIDVAATDRAPGNISRDLKKILGALANQLRAQQRAAGGPENQFYGLQVINPQDEPSQVTSGRFKTSVISGALGVIVTLIIILIYDAQLSRRRPRGRRRTDGANRTRPAPDAQDDPANRRSAARPGSRRVGDERTDPAIDERQQGGTGRAGRVTVPDRDVVGPRVR